MALEDYIRDQEKKEQDRSGNAEGENQNNQFTSEIDDDVESSRG